MVAEIIDPNICKGYLAGNRPLVDFRLTEVGVYNLSNYWELELHIWRLWAPKMLLKDIGSEFREIDVIFSKF